MQTEAAREKSSDPAMQGVARRVSKRHLRVATLLLLGVVLTAAGWLGSSPALLDAGLAVTAGGVLYGILQILLQGKG